MSRSATRPALSSIVGLVLWAGVPFQAGADDTTEEDRHVFEHPALEMRLQPRTPDQLAAFYEARGFPDRAIETVRESCFVTGLVHNRGERIVWLELDNWRFVSSSGTIARRDREYWHARWAELELPRADQATFRWTLLPEVRDLHPDEPAGGNVTLPRVTGPFTVEARFTTGANKQGPEIVARFEDVRCPGDGEGS